MTDFSERLKLYKEGGMIDEQDEENIYNVLRMFRENYGIELCEENADTFMAHLCAAYSRLKTGEEVEEFPEELMEEIQQLATYEKSLEMLEDMLKASERPLNETEQKYTLLHINNLLSRLYETPQGDGLMEPEG